MNEDQAREKFKAEDRDYERIFNSLKTISERRQFEVLVDKKGFSPKGALKAIKKRKKRR